jgi:hypothetical protein
VTVRCGLLEDRAAQVQALDCLRDHGNGRSPRL